MKKTLFIRPPVFLLLFMSNITTGQNLRSELTATILNRDI